MVADLDLVRRIVAGLAADLFDRAVMTNIARSAYVERWVEQALLPAWRHCGGDWGSWDLTSDAGARLEVKQSAVRQPWTDGPAGSGRPSRAIFDIALRTGHHTDGDSSWVPGVCRPADIYVFAHHPEFGAQRTDHRDPAQWMF